MTTGVRQYVYISKTKIGILEAELVRRFPLTGALSAEIPGLGGLELSPATPDQRTELYRRTGVVRRKLEKRKNSLPMPESGVLGTSAYYRDTSVWAHGLYSFAGDASLDGEGVRVVSYLAWRCWHDGIVLLAGSPLNVLGEDDLAVREGLRAYGTTGTWASVLRFAEEGLRTDGDETSVAGVANGRRHHGDGEALPWLDWGGRLTNVTEVPAPPELLASPRGVALAALCLGYLAALPASRMEVAFRVSQHLPLGLRGPVPPWVAELVGDEGTRPERLALLRRCRRVYVGSPLYTAFA
ncbi:hypothetical protein ABZ915_02110 [Streptomyces sp. NPDC046915]|uniref:hypothetical protein n=1 Tax=Streptomyces sp. NPDC046915 TaxID=3155257 RepID=UPI0033CC8C63